MAKKKEPPVFGRLEGTWKVGVDDGVPARGATNFTFRIVELFDQRLGQTVFEVHAKNPDTGNSWLIAECNTRADARDVIRRRREDSDGKKA